MDAVDLINNRYGEQVASMAPMHGARHKTDDFISFGSTGNVRQLYDEESHCVRQEAFLLMLS